MRDPGNEVVFWGDLDQDHDLRCLDHGASKEPMNAL